MPFGDQDYKDRVARMTNGQLQAEKKALNRKLTGHLAKQAVHGASALAIGPFALIGVAYSSARYADAAAKILVVDDRMRELDCYESSRIRDLAGGAAITFGTAGLGHGASHLAHHLISEIDYNHHHTDIDEFVCRGVEHGVEKGSEELIDAALETRHYNPRLPARKMCDGCYVVSLSHKHHFGPSFPHHTYALYQART